MLYTYLIAINRIVVFEGIDAGNWEGHCEAHDRNAKAISDGLFENLQVRCNRGLKSEMEIKPVWMSPTCL